jgi:hypothetical protein
MLGTPYEIRTENHLVHDVLPAVVRAVNHRHPRGLEFRTKGDSIFGGLLGHIEVCFERRYGSKDVCNSPDAIDNSECLRTHWGTAVFWRRMYPMSNEKWLDTGSP